MEGPTLVRILTRAEVASLMRPRDYRAAVETALRAAERGRALSPPPLHLPCAGGGFHAKAAFLDAGGKRVALKFNGNFPGNPGGGLPTIQGAILLADAGDGTLLAVLDSIEITLGRTAAATAIAAEHLAREDARTLLVCGCGAQARAQAVALAEVRPFRRGLAFDLDPGKARRFAEEMRARLGFDFEPVPEVAAAARASDVIVTCTTSRRPFLLAEHVRPGTFVAAIGADSPDKCEIAPELMAQAKVVVDSLAQCAEMGDLRAAIEAGVLAADQVHAELAQVVTGREPGRRFPDETFVFDSTGTALEDVASAALAFERAVERGVGRLLALGAP